MPAQKISTKSAEHYNWGGQQSLRVISASALSENYLSSFGLRAIHTLSERPHPIVTAFLRAGQRNVIKHDRV